MTLELLEGASPNADICPEFFSERIVNVTESVRVLYDRFKCLCVEIALDIHHEANGFEIVFSISVGFGFDLDTTKIVGILLLCADTKRYSVTGNVAGEQRLGRTRIGLSTRIDSEGVTINSGVRPVSACRDRRTFEHCACINGKYSCRSYPRASVLFSFVVRAL